MCAFVRRLGSLEPGKAGSPMHTLTPGEWYLRYICVKCKSKQILFPDMSKGETPIHATYHVTCTECGNRACYDDDAIERYYHPESVKPLFSNSISRDRA